MKYDDASWHFESTPEGNKEERWQMAAAHIGIYLRLCFIRGWASDLGEEEFKQEIEDVKAGAITGTDFLIDYFDCKFFDDVLSDEGNAFTTYYYDGVYLTDLKASINGAFLSSKEETCDFPHLLKAMDDRYNEWLSLGLRRRGKAWWKFW